MTRVRRCVGHFFPCSKPAAVRLKVTYLGSPVDRAPLMCQEHADRASELLSEGWAIVATEPIEQEVPA